VPQVDQGRTSLEREPVPSTHDDQASRAAVSLQQTSPRDREMRFSGGRAEPADLRRSAPSGIQPGHGRDRAAEHFLGNVEIQVVRSE
jgi:hypothetical protein